MKHNDNKNIFYKNKRINDFFFCIFFVFFGVNNIKWGENMKNTYTRHITTRQHKTISSSPIGEFWHEEKEYQLHDKQSQHGVAQFLDDSLQRELVVYLLEVRM